ncbi:LLM class flavin-dependent oxidoreductase [Radiobacillus sp. PE A8.2]|uniref:LLM class flavin-dependent oxidoreductase n=1 Tax=Radiobacillus sp. PE A8.2 TaxID=3380349 RepID=UPI00389076EB
MVKLSILDQSIIPQGSNAQTELHNTVKLAQIAERLGFHRFWVSEHHLEMLGHSSPEVFVAHIAAQTNKIRVGSGGVMLPHYSAYKVAENFRLLEALYPNRIDLGVGRAPGGIPLATSALQEHKQLHHNDFTQQITDLIHYLTGSKNADHRFSGLKAMPDIETTPELWLLGSSGSSAATAANNGISYAFAQFISGQHGGTTINGYNKSFQASEMQSKPQAIAAFFVVCAETDEKAEKLAASYDVHFIQIAKGEINTGLMSPEQAVKYKFSVTELEQIRENRKKILVGSPDTIKKQLIRLSEQYHTEEIMLASMMYDFHSKVKGFQLLAEALHLKKVK